MPSVNVAPGNDPTHDISLNDGAEVYGLLLDGGERAMQEVPLTPPARQFTATQTGYTSGRGRARLSKDQAGFFDSYAAYTLTDEILHNSPRVHSGSGLVVTVANDSSDISWRSVVNPTAVSFTAPANFSVTTFWLWVKKEAIRGFASATLTVSLHSDSTDTPGTELASTTVSAGNPIGQRMLFTISSQSLTGSAKYWIKVQATSEAYRIGASDGASTPYATKEYYSSAWNAAAYSLPFGMTATRSEREYFRFDHYGAMFVVTKPAAASGSQLFVNGALGKATSATSTTIVDTNQSYTADAFIGAFVRITAGTGAGQVREILDNDTTSLTVAAWDITPTTSSYFTVYGTKYWKEITGHGLTKVVSAPVSVGRTIYFPQGESVNIRRAKFEGTYTWADDGTNKADFLTLYKDKVWRVRNEDNLFVVASYSDLKNWGTNLSFSGTIRCGPSEYPATNTIEFDGSLYVAKQDSLWRVFDNVAGRLNLGIEIIPSDTNGKALIAIAGGLYFSWSHSIEKLQGSVLDDIGWWKGEGMPEGRRGFCSSMAGALSWVYATLDGGAANRSALMIYNGRGWHEIFRSDTGERIREVFWQQCPGTNPIVWFSVNNDLYYMTFPSQTLNVLEDDSITFEPESALITSTIDANSPTFYKIVKGVQIVSKNLGSERYIDVDYQVNDDVGTDTWTYAGRASISPVDFVGIGGDGKGEITQMRLRFRMVTETAATPVIMYSWQVTGHVIEPVKYQWNMRIKVSGNQNTKKSAPDHKPDDVLYFLDKAAREMKALRMRSKYLSADDKVVYVSPPTVIRKTINTILKQWTGSVVITLREV